MAQRETSGGYGCKNISWRPTVFTKAVLLIWLRRCFGHWQWTTKAMTNSKIISNMIWKGKIAENHFCLRKTTQHKDCRWRQQSKYTSNYIQMENDKHSTKLSKFYNITLQKHLNFDNSTIKTLQTHTETLQATAATISRRATSDSKWPVRMRWLFNYQGYLLSPWPWYEPAQTSSYPIEILFALNK